MRRSALFNRSQWLTGMPSGDLRPHTLTTGAKVACGEVTYPGDASGQHDMPLFD